jgi:2-methylcitrate dehydratase PrpD
MRLHGNEEARMSTSGTSAERPLAARLAAKICGFGKHQVTQRALAQARAGIIDTVGVTLAGMPESCTQILLRTPGVAEAPGQSLIFGTDRRTSALDATLVNGTASHALDYDDFSSVLGGHQSVPLVAALLALAEERRLSGERVLLAYIVGVETEIRLARAVHFHHYDKGWHPTSTLGTFGAAAATAYLLGLDEPQTTMALAIAASLAGGIKANFGTMTKPLHIGQCGRNGLLAALLADGRFEANPSVLEHHQGFLNVFNGPGTFDSDLMLANWAEPLEIESPTIALKQFPCCGSMHPAIMMMLNLVREEGIQANDVTKIEVLPHGRRLRHTDKPNPKTSIEAKFSVQYVTARALLDGAVRLKDFEGEAHNEPAIRRLLEKTEARPHPDMADDAVEQWGAEVIVLLKDGRRLSRRVDNLVGRGGDNPMSAEELWEKFDDCAQRALPREQIAPLFERLETLESVSDINQLTRLLQVSRVRGPKKPDTPISFAPRSGQEAPETTWVP